MLFGGLFADSIAAAMLCLAAMPKSYFVDIIVWPTMCKIREPACFDLRHKDT